MRTRGAPPSAPPSQPPLVIRLLGSTRYVFLTAILSTSIATVVLLVLGMVEMFRTILAVVGVGQALTTSQARLYFIEAVDLFLVATILYVISVGLYQLFVNTQIPLPPWLIVRSADDMESKLAGVLITILGVFGLEQVTSWTGGLEGLGLIGVVALLIFALSYFVVHHGHGYAHGLPAAHEAAPPHPTPDDKGS
jgi:uncharacterized membrane protein YqhA